MNFEKLLGYQVFKNHNCNDRFKLASSKFVHQYFMGFSVLFIPLFEIIQGRGQGGPPPLMLDQTEAQRAY